MLKLMLSVPLFLAIAQPQEAPGPIPVANPDDAVVVVGAVLPNPLPMPSPQPPPVPKRGKPEMRVSCSPAISNAQYTSEGFRSQVLCIVLVKNPDERLWCPEVAWTFGEGINQFTPSAHQSDCEPYNTEVAERGEPERWSESKLFGLNPGTYQIWAVLQKSGKTIKKDYFMVRVN